MDDALETRGIKYINTETWLLFAPLSKFWLRACSEPLIPGQCTYCAIHPSFLCNRSV